MNIWFGKRITLSQLFSQKRFKKMEIEELADVIGYAIPYDAYCYLPGSYSYTKAKRLKKYFETMGVF